jgi:GNAT superfamily N-acetyltransferase
VSDLELREEPYDGPVAQQLVAAVQLEYVARYGSPDEGPIDAREFEPPHGRFVVGYLDGEPVAMGGLRRHDADSVEIKRMYVVPAARGRGLSRVVLGCLEDLAREIGARRTILETGPQQPEAVALYESSGYERIEGFGYYKCAPESMSYGKSLTTPA